LASSYHWDFQRRIVSGDASLRLYAILDAGTCDRRGLAVKEVAIAWRDAGIRLLQYRDKRGTDDQVLTGAAVIRIIFESTDATLILNDRVHLFRQTGFDGVHIGQTDTTVEETRGIIGADAILGLSTHNAAQLDDADELDVNYVAIGPVYATGTKLNAEPVVGLEGVREARSLTRKPLVAIGGINESTAPAVLAAGANAVAVISGLLPPDGGSLRETADRFRRLLIEAL
jgi:thiamine-phosphate pyrophosphorylase